MRKSSRLVLTVNELRRELSERVPDWLYALLAFFYWRLHPNRQNLLLVPYRGLWLLKVKGLRLFVPKPAVAERVASFGWPQWVLDTYVKKNFADIKSDDTVVDVGAHIGGFTLPASKIAKKVVAIEPEPRNFSCLRENTRDLRNVIAVHKAAWKSKGVLELKLALSTTKHSLIGVSKPVDRSVKVQADSLDNILYDLGIEKVDFLKIDTEGAEPEVLEGARKTLKTAEKIAVGIGPEEHGRAVMPRVKRFLESEGFTVHVDLKKETVFARKYTNNSKILRLVGKR